MIVAFGQNVPEHPDIPKGSRWRNKRSKRTSIVTASSETHVMHCGALGARSRTTTATKWLANYERFTDW